MSGSKFGVRSYKWEEMLIENSLNNSQLLSKKENKIYNVIKTKNWIDNKTGGCVTNQREKG